MKFAAVALLTLAAYSGPIDPEISKWFREQRDRNGNSCCDLADGEVLRSNQYRTAGDYHEVKIGDAWIRVPPEKVIDGATNPMGAPVLFHVGEHIFCFIRSPEA